MNSLDVFGNKGFVEYRVRATSSGGPFVIGENARDRAERGASSCSGQPSWQSSANGKISAFRNYFDEAVLLEQMLAS